MRPSTTTRSTQHPTPNPQPTTILATSTGESPQTKHAACKKCGKCDTNKTGPPKWCACACPRTGKGGKPHPHPHAHPPFFIFFSWPHSPTHQPNTTTTLTEHRNQPLTHTEDLTQTEICPQLQGEWRQATGGVAHLYTRARGRWGRWGRWGKTRGDHRPLTKPGPPLSPTKKLNKLQQIDLHNQRHKQTRPNTTGYTGTRPNRQTGAIVPTRNTGCHEPFPPPKNTPVPLRFAPGIC